MRDKLDELPPEFRLRDELLGLLDRERLLRERLPEDEELGLMLRVERELLEELRGAIEEERLDDCRVAVLPDLLFDFDLVIITSNN